VQHESHEQEMAIAHVHMANIHAESAIEVRAEAIRVARALGCSWEQVGDALGMSRQTAHKRFGHVLNGHTSPT
jgi:hypothetical protein